MRPGQQLPSGNQSLPQKPGSGIAARISGFLKKVRAR